MSGTVLLCLAYAGLLMAGAWLVFRVFVRRAYRQKGRLGPLSSALELLVWAGYFAFPYVYNPPEWVSFWSTEVPVGQTLRSLGIGTILVGFAVAFGTMLWFGIGRAFGLQVTGLIQSGPYRLSRNPQLVGGSLLVLGAAVLWPSWYALGWIALYALIAHIMVLTEEEHLRNRFPAEFDRYCRLVPRYVGLRTNLFARDAGG